MILQETALEPHSLKLEITESAIMEDIDSTATLFNRLKELGVQIDIDDFGIGYSSLNYLAHFPINSVKIDRSFISMMCRDGSQLKIVQAIINLAHGLGMGVVAEGVELENQLIQIKNLGCEQAQGFYFSKPLDAGGARDVMSKLLPL